MAEARLHNRESSAQPLLPVAVDSIPTRASSQPLNTDRESAAPKARLHFLDWFRTLLVCGVVYAHILRTGGLPGGIDAVWLVDRPYHPYPLSHEPHRDDALNVSPLPVRWLSLARQWAVPLLFWVSGSALGCSYGTGVLKLKDKLQPLAVFTAVGMACNAFLWWSSPRNPECSLAAYDRVKLGGAAAASISPCANKGLFFDFTVVADSGTVFPVVFQMWFTIALMLILVVNWPLIKLLSAAPGSITDTDHRQEIGKQYIGTMLLYIIGVASAGKECHVPVRVLFMLAMHEIVFLITAWSVIPGADNSRPVRLINMYQQAFQYMTKQKICRTRAAHYILGGIIVLQFGSVPFVGIDVDGMSMGFLLFILTGFSKFFCLGFVMTRSRSSKGGWPDAKPAASQIWPVAMFGLMFFAPSTNWSLAGNLTYPYFAAMVDRMLYVGGAVIIVFFLDRVSRVMDCVPLPGHASTTALVLYLFHPLVISLLLEMGVRTPIYMWFWSCAISLGMVMLREKYTKNQITKEQKIIISS